MYREGKAKNCIYLRKKKVNEQFGKNMNEGVNRNKVLLEGGE